MNEMNNSGNEFNNQNIEQQNMSQNNVAEPVQQQYVQPTEPVNEQPKKEEKKSYCGLLIVFMVIALFLAGFIVYDKVIKREEPTNQNENVNENNEQNQNNENTYTVNFDTVGGSNIESQKVKSGELIVKPINPTKNGYDFVGWQLNGIDYDFDQNVESNITLVAVWTKKTDALEEEITKKLNGKDVKISFKISGKTKNKKIDVFMDNIKSFTVEFEISENGECSGGYCVGNIAQALKMVKNIKIIKGDKEYLLFELIEEGSNNEEIYIINSEGKNIYNNSFERFSQKEIEITDSSCSNYKNFKSIDESWPILYVGDDGIYFLTAYSQLQVNVYKMSVNKNKITEKLVQRCSGKSDKALSGHLYIMNKTKKVNGKDVTLNFGANIDGNTLKIKLYMNDFTSYIYAKTIYSDDTLSESTLKLAKCSDCINYKNGQFSSFNKDKVKNNIAYWNELADLLFQNIGTINGDKEYLYSKSRLQEDNLLRKYFNIYDSNNKAIFENVIQYSNSALHVDKLCSNINLFSNDETDIRNTDTFLAISNGAVYYFEPADELTNVDMTQHNQYFNNYSGELKGFKQNKLEIKNDKTTITKIDTCVGYAEGVLSSMSY